MSEPSETELELKCIQEPEGCEGPVEMRASLSATGVPYPRCQSHWYERLDRQAEIRERYPDTDLAPDWFDPLEAGERWNDDY